MRAVGFSANWGILLISSPVMSLRRWLNASFPVGDVPVVEWCRETARRVNTPLQTGKYFAALFSLRLIVLQIANSGKISLTESRVRMSPASQVTRVQLADELYQRYVQNATGSMGLRRKLRYHRKRILWTAVIGGTRVLKRVIDIFASLTLLIMGLPFFLLIMLLIKMTDGGPALFWQTRVGFRGREFPFPKFRSMVANAEELKAKLLQQNDHDDSVTFKMKNDPRITWIGRFIRRGSIDELPQLWCVLKGEMSLVGPRPPVPAEVEQYTIADRRRLEAIPGLTCFWQVMGRGEIPFDQQVELDARYIESQSIWLDIKLLFMTIPAVLFGKGAY